MPEVRKTIHFYQLRSVENGQETPLTNFPTRAVLAEIGALRFRGGDRGRYHAVDDGIDQCLWIDGRIAAAQPHVRFCSVRRRGFPEVETVGKLTPLDIPDGSGLVEAVHVVFFPRGIVGAIYNFYGPRPTALAGYLSIKAPTSCPSFLTLVPLVRQDALARLDDLAAIKSYRMRVYTSFLQQMRDAGSNILGALGALQRHSEPLAGEEIEIQVSVHRFTRNDSLNAQPVRRMLNRVMRLPFARANIIKLEVNGKDRQTGRADVIDLLSDDLLLQKMVQVQETRSRALEQVSAFSAIEEAYRDLREELLAAAGRREQ